MKKLYIIIAVVIIIQIAGFAQNLQSGDTLYGSIIDFDYYYEHILFGNQTDNIWQVGEPSTTIFNLSYSPDKAIVTDTLNNYPVNNHSYFDLYITQANMPLFPFQTQVSFIHKFNTDTMLDGGYIEISCDKGQTFTNILYDTNWSYGPSPSEIWNGSTNNLYSDIDTLFNGEKGFSGNSEGWVKTNIAWIETALKGSQEFIEDTVILRFNFISDEIETNKEGWMIDDIRLYSVDISGRVNEYSTSSFVISPNPAKNPVVVEPIHELSLRQNTNLEIYDLTGKLVMSLPFGEAEKGLQIQISDLQSGIYIVKIGKETQKLIIE